MTNQTTRTQIATLCKTLGYGVSFRGGDDAHLVTVTAIENKRSVTIVSGKLAKVLDYIECVAA
jgi:hypothetical protein